MRCFVRCCFCNTTANTSTTTSSSNCFQRSLLLHCTLTLILRSRSYCALHVPQLLHVSVLVVNSALTTQATTLRVPPAAVAATAAGSVNTHISTTTATTTINSCQSYQNPTTSSSI